MSPAFFVLLAVSLVGTMAIPLCPRRDGRLPIFFASETSCSQYYECSNGVPYLMDCPAGLHFNRVLRVCDYPQRARCWRSESDDIPA